MRWADRTGGKAVATPSVKATFGELETDVELDTQPAHAAARVLGALVVVPHAHPPEAAPRRQLHRERARRGALRLPG